MTLLLCIPLSSGWTPSLPRAMFRNCRTVYGLAELENYIQFVRTFFRDFQRI